MDGERGGKAGEKGGESEREPISPGGNAGTHSAKKRAQGIKLVCNFFNFNLMMESCGNRLKWIALTRFLAALKLLHVGALEFGANVPWRVLF